MGQYHTLVNFDKREIISPHGIGLGLKQWEHVSCHGSLSDLLYLLLVASPQRGGGDLSCLIASESEFKVFGRWIGDRIAVFGDYSEPDDFPFKVPSCRRSLHDLVDEFNDITDLVIPAFETAFNVKIDVDSEGWRERIET